MAEPFESRTITVRIARPQHEVYDFASVPENFPRWASGLARSLKKVNGEWIADTPEGRVKVRFTEPNDFGILDHYIALRPGVEIYFPMRVIANGAGSEVLFTLFRLPDTTDETFARDAEWGGARPESAESAARGVTKRNGRLVGSGHADSIARWLPREMAGR